MYPLKSIISDTEYGRQSVMSLLSKINPLSDLTFTLSILTSSRKIY